MKKIPVLPILAFAGMLVACETPAPGENAETVARSFYQEVRKETISGLPTAAQFDRLRPYISTSLAESFAKATREQESAIRQAPDEKPPWIEGDLFGSLYEGASTWNLAGAEENGNHATANVSLAFESDGRKTEWTDTIVLEKQAEGWKVTDIRMGGDWAFKAGGASLAQTLSAAP